MDSQPIAKIHIAMHLYTLDVSLSCTLYDDRLSINGARSFLLNI